MKDVKAFLRLLADDPTRGLLRRRLQDTIDQQVTDDTKPADTDLLLACYQLTARLHGTTLTKAQANTHGLSRRKRVKTAAALILTAAALFLAPLMIRATWITYQTSDDGEQLIIHGNRNALTPAAMADLVGEDFLCFKASTWQGLVDQIGFEPYLSYPSDWKIRECVAVLDVSQVKILVVAITADGRNVTFHHDIAIVPDDFQLSYEYDKDDLQEIEMDGEHFLWLKNYDDHGAFWVRDDLMTYYLYGYDTPQEVLPIIKAN